jgi:hypothetical protein
MRRRAHGQSMVEMALIMPFLVLITLGIVELSYYIFTYSELENATRRSAEWASTTPPWTVQTCDDVMAPAMRPSGCPSQPGATERDECASLIKLHGLNGMVFNRLQPNQMIIEYPTGSTRTRGDLVQIRVEYEGQWLTPIGQRFFGPALKFNFIARRTIISTEPPQGYQPQCTKGT